MVTDAPDDTAARVVRETIASPANADAVLTRPAAVLRTIHEESGYELGSLHVQPITGSMTDARGLAVARPGVVRLLTGTSPNLDKKGSLTVGFAPGVTWPESGVMAVGVSALTTYLGGNLQLGLPVGGLINEGVFDPDIIAAQLANEYDGYEAPTPDSPVGIFGRTLMEELDLIQREIDLLGAMFNAPYLGELAFGAFVTTAGAPGVRPHARTTGLTEEVVVGDTIKRVEWSPGKTSGVVIAIDRATGQVKGQQAFFALSGLPEATLDGALLKLGLGGNLVQAGGLRIPSEIPGLAIGGSSVDLAQARLAGGALVSGNTPLKATDGAPLLASGIIAGGAGNALPPGVAGIIASGGGNIVASGGGNILASGGGNILASGGGNIVASGGGNIVAGGAGN